MTTAQANADLTTASWKQHLVLIVDDEPCVLRTVALILEMEGFRCVTASSGEHGLQVLSDMPVKVVVSDYSMGAGMNGTAFLTEAKKRHPHLVTMMLSAHAESATVLHAINEAGVFQYLLKPFSEAELLLRLSQALQFYHAQAAVTHMAHAKEWMLRRMSQLENFSMLGGLGEFLSNRFEALSHYWLEQTPYLVARAKQQGQAALQTALLRRDETRLFAVVLQQMGMVGRNYAAHQPHQSYCKASPLPIIRAKFAQAKAAACKARPDVSWKFTLESQPNLPEIWLNEESFAWAMHHLLENAIVYNRGELAADQVRSVTVRVGLNGLSKPNDTGIRTVMDNPPPVMEEPTLWIEVQDSGPGLRLFEQDMLFQMFGTVADHEIAATATPEELSPFDDAFNLSPALHIGMGLPVALWCIGNHDGNLRLLNPGKRGACFRIDIPLAQRELIHRLGLET